MVLAASTLASAVGCRTPAVTQAQPISIASPPPPASPAQTASAPPVATPPASAPAVAEPQPSPVTPLAPPIPSWEAFRQCVEYSGRWAIRPAPAFRKANLTAVARQLGFRGQGTANDLLCHDETPNQPGCAYTACDDGVQLTWRYDDRSETLTGNLVLRQARDFAVYNLEKTRPFGAAGACSCFSPEFSKVDWVNAQQLTVDYYLEGGGGRMCAEIDVTSTWLFDEKREPVLVVDSIRDQTVIVERHDDLVTFQRGKTCTASVSWAELLAMPPAHGG